MNNKIIGIIGGMGPQASCEFYRLLIEGARLRYGAKHNNEYPEIILDSIPVPDGFSHPEHMEIVASLLEDRVRRLTAYGATMITFVCNTVCIYKDRLQRITPVEVISVVDEVSNAVAEKYATVLLLASSTALKLRLYQDVLDKRQIRYIVPAAEEYSEINAIISGVLGGISKEQLTERIGYLTDRVSYNRKVDSVVLGCTELPLVFPSNYRLPVYSSLSILAESMLKRYYRKEARRS